MCLQSFLVQVKMGAKMLLETNLEVDEAQLVAEPPVLFQPSIIRGVAETFSAIDDFKAKILTLVGGTSQLEGVASPFAQPPAPCM